MQVSQYFWVFMRGVSVLFSRDISCLSAREQCCVIRKVFQGPSPPPPDCQEAAEFGRIGRYYATESMLVWDEKEGRYDADATPEYGSDTLEAFFNRVAREGLAGQELGDQAVFNINRGT